jgi:hypothetical protein
MKTNMIEFENRNQLLKTRLGLVTAGLSAVVSLTLTDTLTASPKAAAEAPITEAGNKLEKEYAELLKSSQAELERALPKVDTQKKSALQKARDAVRAAEAEATKTAQSMSKIQGAKALVEHAKGKWIGGAEKGIAQAEAALKKATTDAEREAARKDLAKWRANKEDGIKELKIRQESLSKAQIDEPRLTKENEAAKAALAQARETELKAAKALLSTAASFLASDQMDEKLAKAAMLAEATPRGLADFAQQSGEQESLVKRLLADGAMIKQMLEAGGAKFGRYGQAIEIYTAIQKASPKSNEGTLQRLALATSLEHAKPIEQVNALDQTTAPKTVDPVKRYLHYEKAYLDGELDPVFKNLTTWELRMVVDCDAPDEILAWGREALRNHRPDHVYNPDYGWRYSAAVKSEVPYGSQNVVNDLPSLHKYQNIAMNGGVCGRRAFFGRFILQSFGIPTWGVTQKAHAALSHWTPKGWVINLGAGFEHSWWDKDEAPRSGSDFLLESQARARGPEYLKVLRAQWISRILGEKAYNDRKGETGGFWSAIAHDQAVAIASTAVALGPLGQELGEANEPQEKQKSGQAKVSAAEQKIAVSRDGVITIPAVAHGKATGSSISMKSFVGGLQMHSSGGFKTEYELDTPSAGKYSLTVQVTTLQKGQKFLIAANDPRTPIEIAVPYTLGRWQQTQPVEVTLASGSNTLYFALQDGSRGVTIKELILTPAK